MFDANPFTRFPFAYAVHHFTRVIATFFASELVPFMIWASVIVDKFHLIVTCFHFASFFIREPARSVGLFPQPDTKVVIIF